MQRPELCVIYNPKAGRGRALRRMEQVRQTWSGRAEFMPTQHAGHAVQLARQAAEAGFNSIVAAGGDGTVHEVANGIVQSGRMDVTFVVVPLGSANDFAHSVDHQFGPTDTVESAPRIDVGAVHFEGSQDRYFVDSLGLGLNGFITLESRKIHRLRGLALYGLATLRAVRRHAILQTLNLQFDDEPANEISTMMLSVLLGRREGHFVFTPKARLDDGLFDIVHAQRLSTAQILMLLPRVAFFGPPTTHPQIRTRTCARLQIRATGPLTIHLDGEILCTADDRVTNVQIRILTQRLPVRVMRG